MAKYHILLVERSRMMLERLSVVIRNGRNFVLAGRFGYAQEALEETAGMNLNLVLLDTDMPENALLIPAFRKQFPKAALICLGSNWNAQAASQIVKAGASGYLVKPFTGPELVKAIETFSKGDVGSISDVLAFFSPKGKSGKTTLIANLALSLARKTKEDVGIIDADVQFGDMAVFFNLKPQSTIVEAVRDIKFLSPVTLGTYFAAVNKNVHVLCGTKRPEFAEQIEMKNFNATINMARSLYRYILVDLPPAFTPVSITAAECADTVYLVAMDSGAGKGNTGFEVQHMKRALAIFNDGWAEQAPHKVKTIFTRVNPCSDAAKRRLGELISYPVSAIIPNEYTLVSQAANNGRMAVDIDPDSELTYNIDLLADMIRKKSEQRWEKV
ncbi:response regulator [Pectinatus sottacetonis]|uniref:response regulator n=1 Tax=Pectinatus sottacetonis TaxID=1002795 RepID=UPI0018C49774|nr:response regulator [Pectinatus sottacetonis]